MKDCFALRRIPLSPLPLWHHIFPKHLSKICKYSNFWFCLFVRYVIKTMRVIILNYNDKGLTILRNRDETNFIISRNKVVNLLNSVLRGMTYFILQNGTTRNEITRNSTSLRNKKTMLKFVSSKFVFSEIFKLQNDS